MSAAGRLLLDGLRDLLADEEGRAALADLLAEVGAGSEPLEPSGPAPIAYTARSLAEELGVTDRTIRRAIEVGDLCATRRCGKWVIDADDARGWIGQGGGASRVVQRPRRLAARPRAGVLASVAAQLDG